MLRVSVMLTCALNISAVGGVTGPIDEDLFEDEDLDELEEGLTNLDV